MGNRVYNTTSGPVLQRTVFLQPADPCDDLYPGKQSTLLSASRLQIPASAICGATIAFPASFFSPTFCPFLSSFRSFSPFRTVRKSISKHSLVRSATRFQALVMPPHSRSPVLGLLALALSAALFEGAAAQNQTYIERIADVNTECKTCSHTLCPNKLYYGQEDPLNVTCWTIGTKIMGDK